MVSISSRPRLKSKMSKFEFIRQARRFPLVPEHPDGGWSCL